MYSLKTIHRNYTSELKELNQIMDRLSVVPKSYERDIFIQGTFLRCVIIWENFIEESFLAAMCGCKTNSNTILKPIGAKSKNKEQAFKKLSVNRRLRESDYLDWIDSSQIKNRILENFHHRSRFHQIYRDTGILNQIKAIRNHIAHNSKQTNKKFTEQIIQTNGYLAIPDPNAAEILIATNRQHQKAFYKLYIDYYEETANEICK